MKKNIGEFPTEEYLTTRELSKRIKMAPGTIRNLVWRNKFKQNIHYLKPTPRKLLFVWSEVLAWLHENSVRTCNEFENRSVNLINI